MGSSNSKTPVVVIDESKNKPDSKDSFDTLINSEQFQLKYYSSFQTFLKEQSLKELSYIIIRQDQVKQTNLQNCLNSMQARTQQNKMEIKNILYPEQAKNNNKISLKERCISYIRKYSLEQLVLYILVQNQLRYRIPDFQAPYITLVTSNISAIYESIRSKPNRSIANEFKFKRLVKDLYKRSIVNIVGYSKGGKTDKIDKQEWKAALAIKGISPQFFENQIQLWKSMISNFSQYIIIFSVDMMTKLIDIKKKSGLQFRLIYYQKLNASQRDKESIMDRAKYFWMVNSSKQFIADTIKNCTNIIAEQEQLYSQNTLIYTDKEYSQKELQIFLKQIKNKLSAKWKDKLNDKNKWIDQLNLKIVKNDEEIKHNVIKSIFSFIITFDCPVQSIERLKLWLRKQKLSNRVYIYSAEEQKNSNLIQVLNYSEADRKQQIQKYFNQKSSQIVDKCKFQIKFQIGPIQSMSIYKGKSDDKKYQFLKSKMGLITTEIHDKQTFIKNYQKNKNNERQQLIDSNYIICSFDNYNQLKCLLQKQQQTGKGSDLYFDKVKVIIYDGKKKILQPKVYQMYEQNKRIVFMHYDRSRIEEYIDTVYTSKVLSAFFVKKALPNFLNALEMVEQKSKKLNLKGVIVSKNQLLKEVFDDANFHLSTQYDISFQRFERKVNSQNSDTFETDFLSKYANLWRLGYEMVQNNKQLKQQCIFALKQQIKKCLYKCKSYQLIEVSDEQFDYFYIDRLDSCFTYIDLQVAIIYIFSLPHGFANVFQQIFNHSQANCLTPKVFTSYLVILLTCFYSFEDEVMRKTRLVTYVTGDKIIETLQSIKSNQIIFNNSFLLCGKDQNYNQNLKNHCLFLQFENIPMLNQFRIKNYLQIERFSFYKESTEYLVAPFTKFKVRSKVFINGKWNITLQCCSEPQKTFMYYVFKHNSIIQDAFHKAIQDDIQYYENDKIKKIENQKVQALTSLYKKAELIGLNQQKQEMIKSIKEGLEYRKFINAISTKFYFHALNHLKHKQQTNKNTTEIKALYFKKMLGLQKALNYYHLCQYDNAIKQLQDLIIYLNQQNLDKDKWVLTKVEYFKKNLEQVKIKRAKLFNRSEKTKSWKIEYELKKDDKCEVIMKGKQMKWKVGLFSSIQQFYLKNNQNQNTMYLPFQINKFFGKSSFSIGQQYRIITQQQTIKIVQQEVQYKKQQVQIFQERQNKKSFFVNKKKQMIKSNQDAKPSIAAKKIKQKQATKNKIVSNPKLPKIQEKEQMPVLLPSIVGEQLILMSKLQEDEKHLGITKKMQWQAFYYQNDFILVKKGKHYKTKVKMVKL